MRSNMAMVILLWSVRFMKIVSVMTVTRNSPWRDMRVEKSISLNGRTIKETDSTVIRRVNGTTIF